MYNHLFHLLKHILTVNALGSLLNRYYWKMIQNSAILWYFWSIWAFYSPKKISMTPFWPILYLKSSLTIWFGLLFLRVYLKDWHFLPSTPMKSTSQCFPAFWKVSKILIFTPFNGKQCPFLIILAKILLLHFFPKNIRLITKKNRSRYNPKFDFGKSRLPLITHP